VETFDISQNSIGSPACSAGDIQGSRSRDLQQGSCPFTVPTDVTTKDPCDPTICNYNTNAVVSTQCENAITQYCKQYYRIDSNACADFNDIILGENGTCDYDKLPKSAIDALATGIQKGRDGKGIVFVSASGNKFYEGEDINFSGWTNSRYTITVGAVGKDGKHADYSTRKLRQRMKTNVYIVLPLHIIPMIYSEPKYIVLRYIIILLYSNSHSFFLLLFDFFYNYNT